MKRFLLTAALVLLAPAALAAADAASWLARVGPALRGLDYQGTLVVVADGRVDTLRVFHRVDGGRERERLVALSGPPREVIRDGSRVMCIGTGDAPVAYDMGQAGRWSEALAISEAAGLAGYRARLGGAGRVAGHAVQRVEVLATDPWRYGYRLWLETRTGLPLRVDLLDGRGRTIEQVAFTDISLDQRPSDADLAPSAPAELEQVSALPSHAGEPAGWGVPAPPAGFRLRATRPLPDDGVHLLYSDGLASVSVYVERVGGGLRGDARRQRGAVHARSFWLDGWQVLAIGKVPAATVDRFARTVRAVPVDG
ncbi:sigma factor AlgU regulatory protein MucB [Arenimonas soli]|uniref:Sigma factor AlgU regulatory protein MucB n=1 Tax=Arenimonas soli TaxID=2269504 RepID=A0ABQ1HFM0_9GAMM|nr:MucB/RseB C-terminal domain-containing protein [Arenimonas soli]GGA72621.1 sigma factor AlgU regulatory protein MucB [Arenimonas soli]